MNASRRKAVATTHKQAGLRRGWAARLEERKRAKMLQDLSNQRLAENEVMQRKREIEDGVKEQEELRRKLKVIEDRHHQQDIASGDDGWDRKRSHRQYNMRNQKGAPIDDQS